MLETFFGKLFSVTDLLFLKVPPPKPGIVKLLFRQRLSQVSFFKGYIDFRSPEFSVPSSIVFDTLILLAQFVL